MRKSLPNWQAIVSVISHICNRFSTLSHQLPGLLQNCLGEVYTPEEQCLISLSYAGQVCCPGGVIHLWWAVSSIFGSGQDLCHLCHPMKCLFHAPWCTAPKHSSTSPPLRGSKMLFYFPNNRNVNNPNALKILQPPQHLNILFFFFSQKTTSFV